MDLVHCVQSAIHMRDFPPARLFPCPLCYVSKGDFLNDLCVLNTGSNTWTPTAVVGELPEPRSDSQVRNRQRRREPAVFSHGHVKQAPLLLGHLVDITRSCVACCGISCIQCATHVCNLPFPPCMLEMWAPPFQYLKVRH